MRRFGGMTRPERFAASTQQVSPLPIPLPLQNEVVDERRLLTVPWVSLFQWVLNIGTRTFVTGTHADRIDDKNDPAQYRPGTWFWETDRTVLYQVRIVPVVPATVPPTSEPQWVYVLGTMEAPKALRPADLGPYDAGFQFAATDTGQLYLWDGTAWVDITAYPVTVYGTHAQRLAAPVTALSDGALWCETDRGNSLYQIQNGVWWFVSGTMFGTLVPDQRPTDLGTHDAGFCFRSSVPPAREFLWSQTAWVEITPLTFVQEAAQALSLTSGWTNFGSGYSAGAYLRDNNGWVHLRGLITGGTITAGTVIANLPAGYRPAGAEILPALYSAGMCNIQITPAGAVSLQNAISTNGWLSLGGILFATQS